MARLRKRVRVASYFRKQKGQRRRLRISAHYRYIRRPPPPAKLRTSRVRRGRFRIITKEEFQGAALAAHLRANVKRFGKGGRKATRKQKARVRRPRIRILQKRKKGIVGINALFKVINPEGRISFFRKRLYFQYPVGPKAAQWSFEAWRDLLLETYIDSESLQGVLSVDFRFLRKGEILHRKAA